MSESREAGMRFSVEEIQAKMKQSDESLYEEIGLAAARGAIVGDLKNRGKLLFESLKEELQEAVCTRSEVRTLYEKGADQVFLVAAMIDLTTRKRQETTTTTTRRI